MPSTANAPVEPFICNIALLLVIGASVVALRVSMLSADAVTLPKPSNKLPRMVCNDVRYEPTLMLPNTPMPPLTTMAPVVLLTGAVPGLLILTATLAVLAPPAINLIPVPGVTVPMTKLPPADPPVMLPCA